MESVIVQLVVAPDFRWRSIDPIVDGASRGGEAHETPPREVSSCLGRAAWRWRAASLGTAAGKPERVRTRWTGCCADFIGPDAGIGPIHTVILVWIDAHLSVRGWYCYSVVGLAILITCLVVVF